MTEFWIFSAQLLAVALLFVVLPLWRGSARNNDVVRDAANLEIFRDQVAEMDADLANGLLTPELYEQGKRELQARLLDEVKAPAGKSEAQARNPLKILAVVLAIAIPLASLGTYWKLGNQKALLTPEQLAAATDFKMAQTDAELKELQDKVAEEPENPNGLVTLARSLVMMGHYNEALPVYDKLLQLVPEEAGVWAEYADVSAVVNNRSFKGKPTELLERALSIDPNNDTALELSGMAAMERQDYPAAIRHLQNLLQQMPDKNSGRAKAVADVLAQARVLLSREKGGQEKLAQLSKAQPAAASGNERISGTVLLSDAIKAKAAPDDTVFILARAAEGPPMPLAVIRKQVRDLPAQFTLDDSMAMSRELKLSDFDRVVVIARVSKSGDAKGQPGDLQGVSKVLKPGTAGLKISIDSVLK